MTLTTPLDDLIPLTEHVADWRTEALEVLADQRLVRNLVLSGAVSRNGHHYTAEALQQAAPLYQRKPVFLDHAPNAARPYERSTRDLVGTVIAARFDDGRIRGDLQVLDTEAGRTFLALIAAEHATVGMSHVVLVQRGSDPKVVEKIHDVISVDAVVFPATTQGLRESHTPDEDQLTLLQEQLRQSHDELAQLRQQLAEHHAANEVESLLAASGLPAHAVTELFREQLRLTDSPDRRRQLIQERLQLLQRTALPSVLSRPRVAPSTDADTTAFLRAIKGRRASVLG